MIDKINLNEKFALFSEHWSPKVVAQLNGQAVKLVKVQGEFVWHHHDHENELFSVVRGSPAAPSESGHGECLMGRHRVESPVP